MSRMYGSLNFEREMYWAVHEEERLAYVARGVTDTWVIPRAAVTARAAGQPAEVVSYP